MNDVIKLTDELRQLATELKQAVDNPTEQLIDKINQTLSECRGRAYAIFPFDISQDAIDAIEYLTDDARIEITHTIRQHLK